MALIVISVSDKVIVNLIGVEFRESYIILNVLIFYLIFNYSVVPFGVFLQATGNERSVLNAVLVKAPLNIVGNLIFYKYYGIIGIAYSTILNEFVSLLIQMKYSHIELSYCATDDQSKRCSTKALLRTGECLFWSEKKVEQLFLT